MREEKFRASGVGRLRGMEILRALHLRPDDWASVWRLDARTGGPLSCGKGAEDPPDIQDVEVAAGQLVEWLHALQGAAAEADRQFLDASAADGGMVIEVDRVKLTLSPARPAVQERIARGVLWHLARFDLRPVERMSVTAYYRAWREYRLPGGPEERGWTWPEFLENERPGLAVPVAAGERRHTPVRRPGGGGPEEGGEAFDDTRVGL